MPLAIPAMLYSFRTWWSRRTKIRTVRAITRNSATRQKSLPTLEDLRLQRPGTLVTRTRPHVRCVGAAVLRMPRWNFQDAHGQPALLPSELNHNEGALARTLGSTHASPGAKKCPTTRRVRHELGRCFANTPQCHRPKSCRAKESNEAALFLAWTSNTGRRRQLSSLKIRSIDSHLSPGGVPGKAC